MGVFGIKRKKKIIDLSDKLYKKQKKIAELKSEINDSKDKSSATDNNLYQKNSEFVPFPLFSPANAKPQDSQYDSSDNSVQKKKKLSKVLRDMTEKLEDISNQIYRLEQRVEVIEKKLDIS